MHVHLKNQIEARKNEIKEILQKTGHQQHLEGKAHMIIAEVLREARICPQDINSLLEQAQKNFQQANAYFQDSFKD